MTPTEAAKIIGVSPRQVRSLIQTGKLKARKIKTGIHPFYRYSIRHRDVKRYRDEPQPGGWPRGQSRKNTDT